MTGSWDRPCRNPGRQCMRAPCPPGISAASSPADRPPSARKKKGSPKGDHVTSASAVVSPFPSPPAAGTLSAPARPPQQQRRRPASPCLLVWPPSTPPAALSSPMPTLRCRQTQAAPDRVLPCNLLHRSPALGGDRYTCPFRAGPPGGPWPGTARHGPSTARHGRRRARAGPARGPCRAWAGWSAHGDGPSTAR